MRKYFSNDLLEKSPISPIKAILLVLNYFVGYLFLYPRLAVILTLSMNPNATSINKFIELMIYGWMIFISIALSYPELKRSYHNIPSWKIFIKRIGIAFVQLYLISFVCTMLSTYLSGSLDSANQMGISSSLKDNLMLTIFITLCYAPIVEEIVFRGVLFRSFRSRFNFMTSAIISGLLFGGLHIFDSIQAGNLSDVWFILVYFGLGFFFCKAYEDCDSIYSGYILHLINNSLAVLLLIL